jgi:hypothetical protein
MRFLLLSLAIACGSSARHAESTIDQFRRVDSPDLAVRTDATHQLASVVDVGVRVGGTEQQMEAAGRYCERAHDVRPSWLR